jgi:hypothetical protein
VAVEVRNWFSREARVEVAVFGILRAWSLVKRVAGRSPPPKNDWKEWGSDNLFFLGH